MPRARMRTLTDDERSLVSARLRDKTLSVRVWERYRIVDELSSGRSPLEVADRVVIVNAGRIEQIGTPEDVYRHPKSDFVQEFMGDVIGDLSSRRGKILGMESDGNFQKIKAQLPLAELYKYSTSLRSLTQGRGGHTREFSHYEEVPREIADKIIEESKKEKEEDK